MRWHIRGAIVSAALVWSCGSPTDGCGCPPEPIGAVVHGHVLLASGKPVPSATVSAYLPQAGGCLARDVPDGLTLTGTDGFYSLTIARPTDTTSICVLVRIRPPHGSASIEFVDTAVTLAFQAGPVADSAEVNATLSSP